MGDVHWENGQWGRFLVFGKGANGSGPREREAFLFQEGRVLLWWYVEQIRGEFRDDAADPHAPLFPSERLPKAIAALNMPIGPAVLPDTFRRALKMASHEHLKGPVTELFPTCSGMRAQPTTTSRACRCGTCRSCWAIPGRPPRSDISRPPRVTRSGKAWSPPGERFAG